MKKKRKKGRWKKAISCFIFAWIISNTAKKLAIKFYFRSGYLKRLTKCGTEFICVQITFVYSEIPSVTFSAVEKSELKTAARSCELYKLKYAFLVNISAQ